MRRDLIAYEGDLAQLQLQFDSVAAQLDSLNRQMAVVQNEVNSEIELRDLETRQMQKQRRRNVRELDRLDNPGADAGYERSMESRTSHLPTYDPFPTDELRQRLLNELK